MDLILTLIIGGVVGWLASIIMKTNAQMGILANIIVGIVGSVIGHTVGAALGVGAQSGVASWMLSILGAVILIGLLRVLGVFRRPAVR